MYRVLMNGCEWGHTLELNKTKHGNTYQSTGCMLYHVLGTWSNRRLSRRCLPCFSSLERVVTTLAECRHAGLPHHLRSDRSVNKSSNSVYMYYFLTKLTMPSQACEVVVCSNMTVMLYFRLWPVTWDWSGADHEQVAVVDIEEVARVGSLPPAATTDARRIDGATKLALDDPVLVVRFSVANAKVSLNNIMTMMD